MKDLQQERDAAVARSGMLWQAARRFYRRWRYAEDDYGASDTIRAGQLEQALQSRRELNDELRAENTRLRDAVRAVEWVHRGAGGMGCPWCGGVYPEHEPGCQRQVVLGEEGETHDP